MLSEDEARRQLQAAGRYLIEHELTWGNAGNLSARVKGNYCLITASGTRLGELSDEDLALAPLSNGASTPTKQRPSKELPMHCAIYRTRPEVDAVLHAAPFYSTLLACTDMTIPSDWFVEAMYYLERVARVPYHHPGTEALGEAVRAQAGKANILLLENHGVLVYDSSVSEALMGLHTLEFTARMLVAARAGSLEMKPLPAEVVSDFLERSGYRTRRQWPEST